MAVTRTPLVVVAVYFGLMGPASARDTDTLVAAAEVEASLEASGEDSYWTDEEELFMQSSRAGALGDAREADQDGSKGVLHWDLVFPIVALLLALCIRSVRFLSSSNKAEIESMFGEDSIVVRAIEALGA
eukprot:TRINITY_DN55070_c0_g1_i1.p1 TRINITY_DN55070_c0_g1~~TRINITY_DN55070_c0_g1_i1.p1  ORF type:complete len:130 (+),score=32.21 TRINITY_DN55070_c0_g1_i1:84-473(+)